MDLTPSSYNTYAGTYQITTASPVAGPSRQYIYATTPSGYVHKLRVANGHEVVRGGWPEKITTLPTREKLPSSLNIYNDMLYVTTDGYIGDAPPYQGHVVVISLAGGKKVGVWNSLCSATHTLLTPSKCPESDSGIFGRSGAVIDPANGDFLVATGNGYWNGKSYWGDSVIQVSPKGKTIKHVFTPTDQATLNQNDIDLGSTSPAILSTTGPVVMQGGKDHKLKVIDMGAQGIGKLGGSLQKFATPGAAELFSTPAVWKSGSTKWVFVADESGTAAYTVSGTRRSTRLHQQWSNSTAGTSPITAGGLLYIYDPNGELNVYAPTTGHLYASLATGSGHWNSPIVADDMIVVPVGDANNHQTSGQVDLFRP